jgi:hypothetical protein
VEIPPTTPENSQAANPRVPKWVWGVLLVIGLVCLSILSFAGYMFMTFRQMANENPPPLAGFAPPTPLRTEKDGWSTFRFEDLSLQMELPGRPRLGERIWDPSKRLVTEAWATYLLETRANRIEIQADKIRAGAERTLEDRAARDSKAIQADADIFGYKEWKKSEPIDGVPESLQVEGRAGSK